MCDQVVNIRGTIAGKYRLLSKIACGTYGWVFKAENIITNEIKALKKMKWPEDNDITFIVLREVVILKRLNHINIVNLENHIMFNSKIYLVFTYYEMDLSAYINERRVAENKVRSILKQIFCGLLCIHTHKIIHRDLKPQNIMIDKEGLCPKIGDFGLSRFYTLPPRELTPKIASVWYRPPSVILGYRRYSTAVDVWAVGCIFAEMALGYPLFNGDSEIGVLFKIFKIFGTPIEDNYFTRLTKWNPKFPVWSDDKLSDNLDNSIDDIGENLLRKLLVFREEDRIKCNEALEHEYFSEDLKLSELPRPKKI